MSNSRWIRPAAAAVALSVAILAAIWLFGSPGRPALSERSESKGSPSLWNPRADPNGVIAQIDDAARANRFEELRKLEDGLAAFGEDALPEIRKALLADGRPHPDPLPEGEGGLHPRAKLHLLAAAARVESESAELLLDEFARRPGAAQEAWLRMTARDMMDERERRKITNPKSQITKKSQISNLNDGQDGSRGRSPYPVAAGAAGACREQGRAVPPAPTGLNPALTPALAGTLRG